MSNKIEQKAVEIPAKNWKECVVKHPWLLKRRKVCRVIALSFFVIINLYALVSHGFSGLTDCVIFTALPSYFLYRFSLGFSIPKFDRAWIIGSPNRELMTSKLSSTDGTYRINTLYNRHH